MTQREYFQTVLDAHISEDMDKASVELIKKLDDRNEKRKSADSKAKRETADRRSVVLDFFYNHTDTPFTRDAIAEAVNLTPAQVTAACKALILDEMIVRSEVKVDKAKRVVYTMPHEE